jgi:hypothetical protein
MFSLFLQKLLAKIDCEIVLYCYASRIPIKKLIKNNLYRQQIKNINRLLFLGFPSVYRPFTVSAYHQVPSGRILLICCGLRHSGLGLGYSWVRSFSRKSRAFSGKSRAFL